MKLNKIERQRIGNWLLRVPNNIFGRLFLWYFRRHVNTVAYRMRYRGRGNRVKIARRFNKWPRAYDQDLPPQYAETVVVYVDFHRKGVYNA